MGVAALYRAIHQPYRNYGQPEKLVHIRKGLSISETARLLEQQGVVRWAPLLAWYLRLTSQPVQAGEYRFAQPLSIAETALMLQSGRVHLHRITVPEGLMMSEIINLFVRAGFGTRQRFEAAVRETRLLASLDPEAETLEGYLFPETYSLARDSREEEIVSAMVRNFLQIWTPQKQLRAETLGMTAREVVTLASLIEKETALASERPLVSAVFHNRLRQNIKLACDPTVIYAVLQVKEYDGIIHQSDLMLDSPYNTYLYPGLPPGPIANPGVRAIEAALHPADVDYLYFVSRNDGSHHFSNSYREHSRMVMRYQR